MICLDFLNCCLQDCKYKVAVWFKLYGKSVLALCQCKFESCSWNFQFYSYFLQIFETLKVYIYFPRSFAIYRFQALSKQGQNCPLKVSEPTRSRKFSIKTASKNHVISMLKWVLEGSWVRIPDFPSLFQAFFVI